MMGLCLGAFDEVFERYLCPPQNALVPLATVRALVGKACPCSACYLCHDSSFSSVWLATDTYNKLTGVPQQFPGGVIQFNEGYY